MSFWALVGTKINDLECFKQSCRQNDVDYNEDSRGMQMQGKPVHAILTDRKGNSQGYLVRDQGCFKVVIDNDASYSSLTRRLGQNGGRLTRDYAVGVVRKGLRDKGGIVNDVSEKPDGSIVMKIAAVG